MYKDESEDEDEYKDKINKDEEEDIHKAADICWDEYGDWRQLGTFDGGDHLKYFRTQSTEQDCNSSQIRYILSKSSAPEASDFLTCHML